MEYVYPWWYYFSWWFFIWVILYLSGIIPFSPYLLAVFILIYTILKIGSEALHYIFANKKAFTREKWTVIAIWLSLVIAIDVIPFFFLKSDYSMKNVYFTLLLSLCYLALMWYKKVDVIKLYSFMRYSFLTDNYRPMQLIKAHFPFVK